MVCPDLAATVVVPSAASSEWRILAQKNWETNLVGGAITILKNISQWEG
jgi:hypothetical protein